MTPLFQSSSSSSIRLVRASAPHTRCICSAVHETGPEIELVHTASSLRSYGSAHGLLKETRRAGPNEDGCGRRELLAGASLLWAGSVMSGVVPAVAAETANENGPSKAEQRKAANELKEKAVREFKLVTKLQDEAFELTNQLRFAEAEKLWTEIISMNKSNAAAYSNRGNCRTSQRKFDDAIEDFRTAIELSPEEPDPFLGLGVALEGKRDFLAAIKAYEQSNERSRRRFGSDDPAAINNIGNAHAGRGEWDLALANYKRAAILDRNFVFALANEALAYAQLGEDQIAVRTMKFLVRKYNYFPDMHAALAALYWEAGQYGDAESEFLLATGQDYRYRDLDWVTNIRRFPPRIVRDLENLRNLRK